MRCIREEKIKSYPLVVYNPNKFWDISITLVHCMSQKIYFSSCKIQYSIFAVVRRSVGFVWSSTRGKRDGVIEHMSKREDGNWIENCVIA